MPNEIGLTVKVEDINKQSVVLCFDPGSEPEIRKTSNEVGVSDTTEIVVPFEVLTYSLACAVDALENYEEEVNDETEEDLQGTTELE